MAVMNTFFHQEIAGYGPFQSSHQGDHQVMVQVMGLFSVHIKETIMRLQVMVQVMDLLSVLIKEAIMRLFVDGSRCRSAATSC